jgi:hypothetical protein
MSRRWSGWMAIPVMVACLGAGTNEGTAKDLKYVDLVNRLTNLEALAVLPEPGETCQQWSSYDRASRFDSATGKYLNWDANGDGNGIIRTEGKLQVMAEMKGPGCIWRIWSALSEKGHVKIYLDGQEKPVIDLPFKEYFTGKTAPFDYPSLSYHLADQGSRGENLYIPIPYQKSCKIVAEEGWGAYYQFVYTTYPEGTKIPTFQAKLTPEEDAALRKVDAFFKNDEGKDPAGPRVGEEILRARVQVPAGQIARYDLAGPRAITAIRGKMPIQDREDQMAALRKLVVRITFDGESKPAVWCPLGDFFGTAPGENHYKSLTTGMTPQGFYAYWYMPFAKSAKLELLNEDSVNRSLDVEIVHAPLSRPFEGMGHFQCKWHRDIFPLSKDRWPDWTMLRATGRGRFCGVMLHVWNPRGGWWGEGDEKFFVDGETFPSTIGTGSEDYFGYAWCHPGLFQHAYHAQTMTQNNKGHQSVLRWHVTDNIPFQKSFEATIEKYYGNAQGTLYACVPCYYLAPGSNDSFEPTPVAERHGYYVSPPPTGGGFKILGSPNGEVQDQILSDRGPGKWKDDNQLWWTGAQPGDKLDVAFPVKKDGSYEVVVTLTKAIDYGIVQLWVDGKKAGEPIDLFNDEVIPSGPISLGKHALKAGEHKLTVEILGANEKAVKAYMFGLDEIIMK